MIKKFLLFSTCLFAQSESYWDFHPIHVGGNAIGIGAATVEPKHESQQGHLRFDKENVFAYILLPVNRTSYFLPRVEWNGVTMNWDKNPKFNQTRFQFLQFALTFFSVGMEKWRWIARGEYNIDPHYFSRPSQYGLYSALLWGTHELNDQWHYHIGSMGYTGNEGSTVYPIIGIDYKWNKKWLFQAVFPITYSIEYSLNQEWKLSLKGRPLKERLRTGPLEPQPRSVFCYSSMGAEFNVRYEKFLRLDFEAFAGYNFGGKFYIKDKKGKHGLWTKVQWAPYIGASLNWGI